MCAGESVVPLSPTQEPVWLEQLRYPERINAGFFLVTIRGAVEADLLAAACAAVCRTNPELRGLVAVRDGRFWFEIHDVADVFEFGEDRLPCPPGEELSASRAWYLARRPTDWDLTARAAIRFLLLTHAPKRRTLVMAVHHIAFDGRSKFLFARQFITALRALRQGDAPPASVRPRPAVAQPDASGSEMSDAVRHWLDLDVTSLPPLNLPWPDRVDPGQGVASTPRFDVPAPTCARLAAITSEVGVSFFAGLLAGTAAYLGRYGNQQFVLCIPADTSTAGDRDRIGMQVNMVPCVVGVRPRATFRDVVGAAGNALAEVQRFRRVPFHLLLREIRRSCGTDLGPGLFDRFGISYPRTPTDLGEIPGLTLEWDFFAPNSSQSFRVTLHLRRVGEHTFGRLDYFTSVFDAETAERFAEEWRENLTRFVEAADEPLVREPAVRPDPNSKNQVRPADPDGAGPAGDVLHQTLRRQADAAHDAWCLVSASTRISYRDAEKLVRKRPDAEGFAALVARALPDEPASGPHLAAGFLDGHRVEADRIAAAAGGQRLVVCGHPPGSQHFCGALVRAFSRGAEVRVASRRDADGPLSSFVFGGPPAVIEGGHEWVERLAHHLRARPDAPARGIALVCPVDQFLPTTAMAEVVAARVRVVLVLDHPRAGPVAWGRWRPDPRVPGYALRLPHTTHRWRPVVLAPDGRELPPKTPGVLGLWPEESADSIVESDWCACLDSRGGIVHIGQRSQMVVVSGRLLNGAEAERRVAALSGVREVAVRVGLKGGSVAAEVVLVPTTWTEVEDDRLAAERAWRRQVQRCWPADAPAPVRVTLARSLPRARTGELDRQGIAAMCAEVA
jgi:hypothetical protein